jgi:hypothetical protein
MIEPETYTTEIVHLSELTVPKKLTIREIAHELDLMDDDVERILSEYSNGRRNLPKTATDQ